MKEVLSAMTVFASLAILVIAFVFTGAMSETSESGPILVLFGIGFSLTVFCNGKKKWAGIGLSGIYVMLFTHLLYTKGWPFSCVMPALTFSLVTMANAALSGWFSGEDKVLELLGSIAPIPYCIFTLNDGMRDFTDYMTFLSEKPMNVEYLASYGSVSVGECLRHMTFIGVEYEFPWSYIGKAEPYDYDFYHRQLILNLSLKYGWVFFLLAGILIVSLITCCVLLAIRRKGLGRFFCIAAACIVGLPLVLFFLSNLGLVGVEMACPPLLSRSFWVNLTAVLLLWLATSDTDETPAYQTSLCKWHVEVPDDDESDDGKPEDDEPARDEAYHETFHFGNRLLRTVTVTSEADRNKLFDDFDLPAEIPFKTSDYRERLKDKELLFSLCSGDADSIRHIFDGIKLLGSDHFVKIRVNRKTQFPLVLASVEQLTEAMTDCKNVDFALASDEDIPDGWMEIMTVSLKQPREID